AASSVPTWRRSRHEWARDQRPRGVHPATPAKRASRSGSGRGARLQRYAVERFLYRLGRASPRGRVVLEGATPFPVGGAAYRPTRDIDFTGYGSSNQADVIRDFREICDTPDAVDQLVFDTASITAEPIRDGSEYDGLRVRIRAGLGGSDIVVQIDVGF